VATSFDGAASGAALRGGELNLITPFAPELSPVGGGALAPAAAVVLTPPIADGDAVPGRPRTRAVVAVTGASGNGSARPAARGCRSRKRGTVAASDSDSGSDSDSNDDAAVADGDAGPGRSRTRAVVAVTGASGSGSAGPAARGCRSRTRDTVVASGSDSCSDSNDDAAIGDDPVLLELGLRREEKVLCRRKEVQPELDLRHRPEKDLHTEVALSEKDLTRRCSVLWAQLRKHEGWCLSVLPGAEEDSLKHFQPPHKGRDGNGQCASFVSLKDVYSELKSEFLWLFSGGVDPRGGGGHAATDPVESELSESGSEGDDAVLFMFSQLCIYTIST
jgi:hypothetical protein